MCCTGIAHRQEQHTLRGNRTTCMGGSASNLHQGRGASVWGLCTVRGMCDLSAPIALVALIALIEPIMLIALIALQQSMCFYQMSM